MRSDVVKFNRKIKLIAAALFASIMLTGVFAGQAQAQSVWRHVSGERHIVAQRPVNVGQIVTVRRRQRVYTYQYPRYRYRYRYGDRDWRYYHHRHHNGIRVWIR